MPIAQVQIITLDFACRNALSVLNNELEKTFGITGHKNIDLVVSDLCVNLSGNSCVDNANNLLLWELAFELCCQILMNKGHFVIKYFESQESIHFRRALEQNFDRVDVFKPKASRSESSEKYFICINKK